MRARRPWVTPIQRRRAGRVSGGEATRSKRDSRAEDAGPCPARRRDRRSGCVRVVIRAWSGAAHPRRAGGAHWKRGAGVARARDFACSAESSTTMAAIARVHVCEPSRAWRAPPRGSASAHPRGRKLVAIYPCALDRLRYTSKQRLHESRWSLLVIDVNKTHAQRRGMQRLRVVRAVCALHAPSRRARALKRVGARDGREDEGQG